MPRLKLLFVAVAIAALGGWYLSQRADGAASRIQQEADERLRDAAGPVNAELAQDAQAPLASVKAVAQGNTLAAAVDAEGKPTPETLEVARTALERVQSPEAERPVLIAVVAQGVAGRYRVGQSNRIDRDLGAFAALAAPGPLPRAGIAVLDGEAYRFAVAQFDDGRAQGKGLLAIGFPVDDAFAQRLSAAAAGADIALVTNGTILGSTLPPAERQALQQVASGSKGVVTFGALSGERFLITDLVPPLDPYLKLPLFTAGHRYRGRVLGAPPELAPDIKVLAAVKTGEGYGAIADEQRQLLIGIGALVLLCIVLMLATRNPTRGLSRVVSAAERIVQGDHEVRAPTVKMGALVRRAAVAINALGSQAERSAESSRPVTPDLAEQLGIRPVRNSGSHVAVPVPAAEGAEADTVRALAGLGSSQVLATTPPPVPFGAPSPSRKSNPAVEPMVLPQKPKPISAPPLPANQESEGGYNPEATVIVSAPQALPRSTQPPAFQRTPSSSGMTASGPTPAPIALPSPFAGGTEEAHFQQVYRDFVATKEKCGEPADGLTYEKFAAKLRKNQEQLIAKYACRAVRFQVYVKDGKTALKAQPIK